MTDRIITVPASTIEEAVDKITGIFREARAKGEDVTWAPERGDTIRVAGPPGTETQVFRVLDVDAEAGFWTCEPA